MRYIKKVSLPDCFQHAVKKILSEEDWSEFQNPEKLETAKYIIEKEQKNLCVYCEQRISNFPKDCHIEHLKPRSIDKKHNTFNYSNLAVSCNSGKDQQIKSAIQYTGLTCGHKKGERYDEKKFLSPVELENISDYFVFDFISGSISFSELNQERAAYMIDLLNLNDKGLQIARRNALINLRKIIQENNKTKNEKKSALIKILDVNNKKLRPYHTFLRFCFKDLLK